LYMTRAMSQGSAENGAREYQTALFSGL
jgi:hypothetical protein